MGYKIKWYLYMWFSVDCWCTFNRIWQDFWYDFVLYSVAYLLDENFKYQKIHYFHRLNSIKFAQENFALHLK